MLRPEITQHSARDAVEQAGIGPQDVDVVELHDAFSIAELVYYEALGLCEDGESASFLTSGQSTFGGAVVVNPSGGLLSKEIGRASCRERVCLYVWISVVAVSFKNNT